MSHSKLKPNVTNDFLRRTLITSPLTNSFNHIMRIIYETQSTKKEKNSIPFKVNDVSKGHRQNTRKVKTEKKMNTYINMK